MQQIAYNRLLIAIQGHQRISSKITILHLLCTNIDVNMTKVAIKFLQDNAIP